MRALIFELGSFRVVHICACTMANTTQIDLFCNDQIGVRPTIESSQQQLLPGRAGAAALGHNRKIALTTG